MVILVCNLLKTLEKEMYKENVKVICSWSHPILLHHVLCENTKIKCNLLDYLLLLIYSKWERNVNLPIGKIFAATTNILQDWLSILKKTLVNRASSITFASLIISSIFYWLKFSVTHNTMCCSLMKVHKAEWMMLFYYGGPGYNTLSP